METPAANPAIQIQATTSVGISSIYVEGLSQMMIGFPNSRLLFHNLAQKNTANPDGPEIRNMTCELIIPTASLIEMAQGILKTLTANKQLIESTKSEWLEKLNVLTNSI